MSILIAILFFSYLSASFGQCQYIPLSGKEGEFGEISFIDSLDGIIGSSQGVVLRTTDGGFTWLEEDIRYGTNLKINSVSMVNRQIAYAVTSEGEIFKTTNGGLDWISKGFPAETYLNSISFIDVEHGVVAGGMGRIGVTTDGGNTWNISSFTGGIIFYSAKYVDDQTIFAVGSQGTILRSTDAGNSWSSRLASSSNIFRDLSFIGKNGFVCGYKSLSVPLILKTDDNGETWSEKPIAHDAWLSGIDFIDSLRGVVCGGGVILSTINGGTSWKKHPVYGFSNINQISYLINGGIIAGGQHVTLKNCIIKISKEQCSLPFAPVFPKNNSVNIPIWKNQYVPNSIRFSWMFYSPVKFISANLQISNDTDFSNPVIDTILAWMKDENDTVVVIPDLLPKTLYFWRLSFRNLDGSSTYWSKGWQFKTAGGMISGRVFEDFDQDNYFDQDEKGISNWALEVSKGAVITIRTDTNGFYQVVGLDSGNYIIRDFNSPLWRRLKPDSGYYNIILNNDEILQDYNFTYYFPWNTIDGYLFSDNNQDGIRNDDDENLVNWCVKFSGPLGNDSIFTDDNGYFSFLRVSTGYCTVKVNPLLGWEQIFPRLGREHSFYFYDYNQHFTANFCFQRIPKRIKNILYYHDSRANPVVKLQWGVRSGATCGIWGVDPNSSFIDYAEGELEIPPPLPGAMDARFVSPPNTDFEFGLGSWIDIRPYISSSQTDTYLVRFAAGTLEGGGFPVTFRWSADQIRDSYSSPIFLTVPSELNIDMREIDSLVIYDDDMSIIRIIATNPIILPDGIRLDEANIPTGFKIEQNYPNPFNGLTTFTFSLPEESKVELRIFNIIGEEISCLLNDSREVGTYKIIWDASNISSGVYIYRFRAISVHDPKIFFLDGRKLLYVK